MNDRARVASQIVTFLAIDLVESNAVLTRLGEGRAQTSRAAYVTLLRNALGAHHGRELLRQAERVLAAFDVEALTPDSSGLVVDVTDFFQGDTPALSGLSQGQRREYGVRRLDPARSFISRMSAYPENVEVRHTQTFDATSPPGDAGSGTSGSGRGTAEVRRVGSGAPRSTPKCITDKLRPLVTHR